MLLAGSTRYFVVVFSTRFRPRVCGRFIASSRSFAPSALARVSPTRLKHDRTTRSERVSHTHTHSRPSLDLSLSRSLRSSAQSPHTSTFTSARLVPSPVFLKGKTLASRRFHFEARFICSVMPADSLSRMRVPESESQAAMQRVVVFAFFFSGGALRVAVRSFIHPTKPTRQQDTCISHTAFQLAHIHTTRSTGILLFEPDRQSASSSSSSIFPRPTHSSRQHPVRRPFHPFFKPFFFPFEARSI